MAGQEQRIEVVRRYLAADGTAYRRWLTWGYPGENDWNSPRENCDLHAVAEHIIERLDAFDNSDKEER